MATGAAPLPPPLEHVLLDETLPLDVKALWRLMMADADFWREFLARRQARGTVLTGWVMVDAETKRALPRRAPCVCPPTVCPPTVSARERARTSATEVCFPHRVPESAYARPRAHARVRVQPLLPVLCLPTWGVSR